MRSTSRLMGLTVLGVLVAVASVEAQPGRGDRGGFGRGGSGMELLYNDSVREELGIVDEQMEQLEELQRSTREEMGKMFRSVDRDLPREERFAQIREKMESYRTEMQEQFDDILLEHQRDRLKQLQFQSRIQRNGAGGALESEDFVEQLGITDDQLEEIKELRPEIEKEYQEKVAKARQAAIDRLLAVLTSDQRKQYEELVGQSFEFGQQRRGRDRGGRDRGDRGGRDRGGRDRGGRRGGESRE